MATVFQFPYRTVAEISLRALLKNLYTLRIASGREVIPVVKADAYGHGMVPISRALVQRGSCQMLAVATLEEAMEVRENIPRGVAILVLSGFLPHQFDAYLKYRLVPMIHSLPHLRSLIGRKVLPELHLKIDSGMHRLGILPEEVEEAGEVLRKLGVKLAGVATQFAESDTIPPSFSKEQISVFEKSLRSLVDVRVLATDARIHVGNSGAILQDTLGFSNAVRPGLSLYGVSPNDRLSFSDELVPVLEWKSRILAIKELPPGATVGYGRTYECKKPERIAILPVGYADGIPRAMSNRGHVLIGSKKCPLRGRVSMDLIAIDVSNVASAKEGQLVTIIGKNGKAQVTAWDLAENSDTIPYEIFCRISARVPRIYLD